MSMLKSFDYCRHRIISHLLIELFPLYFCHRIIAQKNNISHLYLFTSMMQTIVYFLYDSSPGFFPLGRVCVIIIAVEGLVFIYMAGCV